MILGQFVYGSAACNVNFKRVYFCQCAVIYIFDFSFVNAHLIFYSFYLHLGSFVNGLQDLVL